MKVLSLQCGQQHGFEGWFGSEDDFQSQLTRGLLACPLCGNTAVVKLPSAPRLNLSGAAAPESVSARANVPAVAASDGPKGDAGALTPAAAALAPSEALQAAFLSAVREVIRSTEDVGDRFAEEARRMHYGETDSRNIRGQTSPREAVELIEEGIDVMPLPIPDGLKHTLQ